MLYVVVLRANLIANSCFLINEFSIRPVKHFSGLIVGVVYVFSLYVYYTRGYFFERVL